MNKFAACAFAAFATFCRMNAVSRFPGFSTSRLVYPAFQLLPPLPALPVQNGSDSRCRLSHSIRGIRVFRGQIFEDPLPPFVYFVVQPTRSILQELAQEAERGFPLCRFRVSIFAFRFSAFSFSRFAFASAG